MGLLGWSERQALSANICSVMGALRSHGREVLDIHFPEAAKKLRQEEERKHRRSTVGLRFSSWASQHNAIVRSSKKPLHKKSKRKGKGK